MLVCKKLSHARLGGLQDIAPAMTSENSVCLIRGAGIPKVHLLTA